MTTYLLVQTEPGRAREAVTVLRSHPDVVRVEQVDGPYDVVALVRSVDRAFGKEGGAADVARAAPGVLRALECVILDGDARPAA